MLKTVSTQLALASDTLPEVLAKGNTTGGTDLAVSAGDDITLADNSKVIFGAGSDLQIYSDGFTGQVTGDVNVTGSGTFSNKVGIGTSSPAAANKVQVNLATNTVTTGSPVDSSLFSITGGTPTVGDGVSLQITNLSGAKETGWRISAVTASANNGDLVFNGYAGGADYPERMRLTSGGNLILTSGSIVLPSTAGIDFSATAGTGTSELLDDYEEGTWTPVVSGTGTAGTYEIGTNGSTYTKVGRTVTLQNYIQFAGTVTGGGTGSLQITGLPFAKSATSYPVGSVYLALGTWSGNHPTVIFGSFGASSQLLLQQDASGGYGAAIPVSFASANAFLTFTITYEV
jgi:hypothetical protein